MFAYSATLLAKLYYQEHLSTYPGLINRILSDLKHRNIHQNFLLISTTLRSTGSIVIYSVIAYGLLMDGFNLDKSEEIFSLKLSVVMKFLVLFCSFLMSSFRIRKWFLFKFIGLLSSVSLTFYLAIQMVHIHDSEFFSK